MSDGYAARLSEYPNKGVVGLPEKYDSKRVLTLKLRKLTEAVKTSSRLVFVTGAGISTAAKIPDFRGPNGIWTLEKSEKRQFMQQTDKKNRKRQQSKERGDCATARRKKQKVSTTSSASKSINFLEAKPTITHRAITFLADKGEMNFCITQNVDGLHRRSGMSRDFHASVHGCVFTEVCSNPQCGIEYFRDFDVGGMSCQPTGRKCQAKGCGADLYDTLLDWEDPLPEEDLERAEREASEADLIICLGTSLRIEPVGSLPLRAKKFIIVNLQATPFDNDASLVIRAPVDKVMDHLLQSLGYIDWKSMRLPPIERQWTRRSSKSVSY